ncbi:protein-disulfide isomerase [Oryzomonas rubra]|uniref:Protein-disulfide isomerase n=2 Tax=Oryzomonas rubra TaxID=2509454 RepID=A0A5A9XIH8_9BACT|nr:protein-disulfide isomerase [Oryzomonas rubra]
MNKKEGFMNCFKYVLFVIAALVLYVGTASASGIDFDKAIVIGSGPKKVVEFTDPDCPFCRKAAKFFAGRTDVTQYIFFWPLPRHPKAKEKAQFILSQHDKAKAYHDVMSGKLDSQQTFTITPAGIKLQEEQYEIVKKNNVSATPTFMLFGRIIEGFDQKKIEEALGR